ncbi:restriction endonuclease subunit S [Actinoplanes sp. NPDC049118]|uniref:restriction endonuclease subunit S n=1 Tax=Actinoplanes sp. NPDC049118 TaxID=3155769 RepID=UPI0033ECD5D3
MSTPVRKLSEIAELNPRTAERPGPETPVSFVAMSDVDADAGTTTTGVERRYADTAKGYTQFADRDLLVAKITPCFENGKIAQAGLAHPHGAGSTEFHVVRPDRAHVHDRYLLAFLRRPAVRVKGERRMTGSGGQRRVPEAFLADLDVPLPSLAEQRRIADILDRADALRAKRRASLAPIGELYRSIFLEMFGDPLAAPGRWPTAPLATLGTLDRGMSKHRPRNDPALLGGAYALVQTGDVARSGGYIEEYSATYSELGLAQSRLWPAGTLCITIAANIAKAGILQFDACFPDSVVGFSSDPQTVEYVRAWLSFMQQHLERLAPESAQKNINLAVLRSLEVPQPPRASICEFAGKVRQLRSMEQARRKHLAALESLMSALRDRAFRGEL